MTQFFCEYPLDLEEEKDIKITAMLANSIFCMIQTIFVPSTELTFWKVHPLIKHITHHLNEMKMVTNLCDILTKKWNNATATCKFLHCHVAQSQPC